MKVSVIMPVYNRETYIGSAIRSILRQRDAADLDIIVVDDGSTDGTNRAVRSASEGTACLRLIHQPHKGVSAARNNGLAHVSSDSELITFLDSDDISVAGRFAAELPLFRDEPLLALTYSRMTLTNEIDENTLLPGENAHTCTVRGISLATAIFRKQAIDSLGGFNEGLVQSEDWDFLLRFFEMRQKHLMLEHVSILHRRHPGNATKDRAESMRNYLRVLLLSTRRRRLDPSLGSLPRFFDVSELFDDVNAPLR